MTMNITLFTSVFEEQWNDKFRQRGIKAGEIEGEANGHPAILVMGLPFPLGDFDDDKHHKIKIIEFVKDTNEVFIDWDDFEDDDTNLTNIVKYDESNKERSYKGVNIRALIKLNGMSNSYVNEIKPNEINKVHTIDIFKGEYNGIDKIVK
jgi:hypothetical protein